MLCAVPPPVWLGQRCAACAGGWACRAWPPCAADWGPCTMRLQPLEAHQGLEIQQSFSKR